MGEERLVRLGFVTSFVAALLAVKWLVAWLNLHGLMLFGVYRVVLGLGVATLIWKGVLPAE